MSESGCESPFESGCEFNNFIIWLDKIILRQDRKPVDPEDSARKGTEILEKYISKDGHCEVLRAPEPANQFRRFRGR